MIDVNALPLDSDQMLAGLRPWIECESPTYEPEAVNRMLDIVLDHLKGMGAQTHRIAGPEGLGDCARASFPHPREGEPGILILAHLDTVHPIGTLRHLPFRREGERCTGPGICDMKGGTYAAIEAVAALHAAGVVTPLPVSLLLTSDEEIGTPGTRALIEAEAARHRAVLVPEPGLAGSDHVITGRYAIARYALSATGTASHAGIRLKEGRSAIAEMARRTLQIEAMSDADVTYSVGVVAGGRWVNCVPTRCTGEALSMAKRQADLDRSVAAIEALSGDNGDGTAFQAARTVTRPVWEPDEGTMALYALARDVAQGLGITLQHASAGGGSDANFTGAMGIPTLDGLGLDGELVHTLGEWIEVESLARRARLMAGIMAALDGSHLPPSARSQGD